MSRRQRKVGATQSTVLEAVNHQLQRLSEVMPNEDVVELRGKFAA